MKLTRTILGFVTGLSAMTALTLTPLHAAAAGSNVFSVSPTGGSYKTGNTLTMVISENSATNDVDSARAELTYNQATLQVVGFSTAGNPFTTCLGASASAGAGKISTGNCTLLGGKKQGKQTLGSVTFKVLANSGSSSVAFTGTSQLINNGVNLGWSQVGATYSFSAPASNPSTPPASGGSNPTSGNPATGRQASTTTASSTPAGSDQSTNNTANTSSPAGKKAQEVAAAQTKKSENSDGKSDAQSTGNTAKNSSKAWLWIPVTLAAVAAGLFAARKVRGTTPAATKKVKSPVAAAATKPKATKSTGVNRTAKPQTTKAKK